MREALASALMSLAKDGIQAPMSEREAATWGRRRASGQTAFRVKITLLWAVVFTVVFSAWIYFSGQFQGGKLAAFAAALFLVSGLIGLAFSRKMWILGEVKYARTLQAGGDLREAVAVYEGILRQAPFKKDRELQQSFEEFRQKVSSIPDGEWFYQAFGEVHGPVAIASLLREVAEGSLTRESLVRHETQEEWQPAHEVLPL